VTKEGRFRTIQRTASLGFVKLGIPEGVDPVNQNKSLKRVAELEEYEGWTSSIAEVYEIVESALIFILDPNDVGYVQ